jgi:hypothetical protein
MHFWGVRTTKDNLRMPAAAKQILTKDNEGNEGSGSDRRKVYRISLCLIPLVTFVAFCKMRTSGF